MLKKVPTNLPDAPGVYKMLDEDGVVIYIGKAKSLKKRVSQYFKKGYSHSTRTRKLMEKVCDIEVIVVDSDLEAVIVEGNLLKELKPKYNVIMKDDKSYVYIKITKEDFPRVQIVRQVLNDGAKYIGPKTAKHKVKETLKLLKKIFPFRHCGLDIAYVDGENEQESKRVKVTRKVIKYPCLDFFIKRCAAPCVGKVSPEDYGKIIRNVEDFLRGKAEPVLDSLRERMAEHAANKNFEHAAKVRDKLMKVESILEKQKVADSSGDHVDVVNYFVIQGQAYFNLFQIRDGKLLGNENFTLEAEELSEEDGGEVLEVFLENYYGMATDLPRKVILPHEVGIELDFKVEVPKIGKKDRLLSMCLKNAQIYADRSRPSWKVESDDSVAAIEDLKKVLKLKELPKRMECYDISHLGGTNTVASMVVFNNGAPNKKMYRKFNVRSVEGKPDDYKSMEEVLKRRFVRIAKRYQLKDFVFKKALKKDDELIQKEMKKNHLNRSKDDYKVFYCLKKADKIAALGRIIEFSERVSVLASLLVMPKFRKMGLGYKIMGELIKKSKTKRVYIMCKPELKDYYLKFGFEEVKKVPKEVAERYKDDLKTYICLAYDKIKQKEDASFSQIPDLVVIDGGKGQLGVCSKVLSELGLEKIRHISLAKRLEEIFVPGRSESTILPRNSKALRLLQRARDEAHRFAITFQRSKRGV